jgi:hypothetical protein
MMEKSGQSLYGDEDGFGMVYVNDVVVGYSCIRDVLIWKLLRDDDVVWLDLKRLVKIMGLHVLQQLNTLGHV